MIRKLIHLDVLPTPYIQQTNGDWCRKLSGNLPSVKVDPMVEMSEGEVAENLARALRELDMAQKRVAALRQVMALFVTERGPTG